MISAAVDFTSTSLEASRASLPRRAASAFGARLNPDHRRAKEPRTNSSERGRSRIMRTAYTTETILDAGGMLEQGLEAMPRPSVALSIRERFSSVYLRRFRTPKPIKFQSLSAPLRRGAHLRNDRFVSTGGPPFYSPCHLPSLPSHRRVRKAINGVTKFPSHDSWPVDPCAMRSSR